MRPIGLAQYMPNKAYHGFTLFAPMQGKDVYLIDMVGNFVRNFPPIVGRFGRIGDCVLAHHQLGFLRGCPVCGGYEA